MYHWILDTDLTLWQLNKITNDVPNNANINLKLQLFQKS